MLVVLHSTRLLIWPLALMVSRPSRSFGICLVDPLKADADVFVWAITIV